MVEKTGDKDHKKQCLHKPSSRPKTPNIAPVTRHILVLLYDYYKLRLVFEQPTSAFIRNFLYTTTRHF